MSIPITDQSRLEQPEETAPVGEVTLVSGGEAQAGGVSGLRCESCGAPVAAEQRYCVECGSHRVGVNDPAAAYMNRANVRTAPRGTRAVVVSSRRNRLTTALMLALIPIAIGVGILIGRSSNNQDPRLLRAISQEKAQVVTVQSAASSIVTVSGGASSGGASRTKSKHTSSAQSASGAAAGGHAPSSSVGAKPTKAQQQQSAKIVKKLQKTNGLSYLDPLPSQVGG